MLRQPLIEATVPFVYDCDCTQKQTTKIDEGLIHMDTAISTKDLIMSLGGGEISFPQTNIHQARLPLSAVTRKENLYQFRESGKSLNDTITDYKQLLSEGEELPPVKCHVLRFDGKLLLILVDGHARLTAREQLYAETGEDKWSVILANVYRYSEDEAHFQALCAVGRSNATHGQKYSKDEMLHVATDMVRVAGPRELRDPQYRGNNVDLNWSKMARLSGISVYYFEKAAQSIRDERATPSDNSQIDQSNSDGNADLSEFATAATPSQSTYGADNGDGFDDNDADDEREPHGSSGRESTTSGGAAGVKPGSVDYEGFDDNENGGVGLSPAHAPTSPPPLPTLELKVYKTVVDGEEVYYMASYKGEVVPVHSLPKFLIGPGGYKFIRSDSKTGKNKQGVYRQETYTIVIEEDE